mmetsp:Transcript_29567/g.75921  ORF Transcript_29567/g.75921 Transcript_29567/m.75921 type:complete len:272 (+) Transcript_29567:234-1049(+)
MPRKAGHAHPYVPRRKSSTRGEKAINLLYRGGLLGAGVMRQTVVFQLVRHAVVGSVGRRRRSFASGLVVRNSFGTRTLVRRLAGIETTAHQFLDDLRVREVSSRVLDRHKLLLEGTVLARYVVPALHDLCEPNHQLRILALQGVDAHAESVELLLPAHTDAACTLPVRNSPAQLLLVLMVEVLGDRHTLASLPARWQSLPTLVARGVAGVLIAIRKVFPSSVRRGRNPNRGSHPSCLRLGRVDLLQALPDCAPNASEDARYVHLRAESRKV